MDIYLISFTSELNKSSSLLSVHEVLLSEIEKYFTLHIADYKDLAKIPEDAFKIVFIASGGVERLVVKSFEQLPYPLYLLTDGLQNSLAAALEIATWIRYKGMKAHIIHGETQTVIKQLITNYNNHSVIRQLKRMRIGVIGAPAPWLIASDVDYLLAKRRWGVEYTDIRLEQVYDAFYRITDEEVSELVSAFESKALACREASVTDLYSSMRLYKAIKNICEEEQLSACTLSCFTLFEHLKVTGCVALSLLNDNGILAGCEGDLQSIFSLLTTKLITGETGFMANPSLLNERTNEILLSHCSIGTTLTEKYIIRSHFETGSSTAIQGIVPLGDTTVIKCGGECLDEYFVSSGNILENTNYVNACRTQIRVKLDKPVSYFLKNPLGNHHILVRGNHEEVLNEFFQNHSCKRAE